MKEDRRQFVKTLAATGVAVSGIREAAGAQRAARPSPAVGGRRDPWPIFGRKTGLKIKSVETFTRGDSLSIVRVKTDDGSEGYGQVAPYDADITATVLHRKIARRVLGQDPADLPLVVDRCIEDNYKFPWSFVCRALAGVDTAVWDLLGRREKTSVCELIGGKPRLLPVYGSSMSRTIKPDDEAARLVRLRDERGFGAFKIRIGKVCGRDEDEWPGRTDALVPAVRKAVGDRVTLLADGNSGFSASKAIEVGHVLEDHHYGHFEEPCPYWELEWTAEVAAALRVPVAGGEQDNDLAQWRRMIAMRAVDIAQPDICYVGGLTRALRVASMAELAGLRCVPHSANLSLVTVFTLHMMGAIPNAAPHVEYTIENDQWNGALFEPALEVRDGRVRIPDGPGWGVTIKPSWLDKATRQVTE